MQSLIGTRHLSLNGLWLPANFAAEQVRRTCVSLHANTGDSKWPSCNLGSAFLYRYLGRRFCIFSRHQFLNTAWTPSQLCVHLTDDRHRLFTGGRIMQYSSDLIEEHDLCAMEMPWENRSSGSEIMWFEASNSVPTPLNEIGKAFAIGYPSRLTEMEVDEECAGVHLTQVRVWADEIFQEPGCLPFLVLPPGEVMLPRCDGSYDGFSGGPVFGLNSKRRLIEFLGIVIRGGHPRLFFIPTEWINRLCDFALNEPPLQLSAA